MKDIKGTTEAKIGDLVRCDYGPKHLLKSVHWGVHYGIITRIGVDASTEVCYVVLMGNSFMYLARKHFNVITLVSKIDE